MIEDESMDLGASGEPQQTPQQNPTWGKLRSMRMAVPVMDEPCPLSISTRGIGFMLSRIMPDLKSRCSAYDSDDQPPEINVPIAAMYRASLIQLEAKMYFARENQLLPFSFRSASNPALFDQPEIFTDSLRRAFVDYPKNVSLVALVINSIGHVKVNEKNFEPRFLAERSPLNIRIINLREYCVEMSNFQTESAKRLAGYELNSIPNAKWEFDNVDDPQSVYLTNPDEIIPADYNDSSMEADLKELNEFVSKIGIKELCGEIEYKRNGNPGILTSTHVVPGESMRMNDNAIDFKDAEICFWSRECIERLSWTIGAIALAGEILDPSIVSQRSQSLAAQKGYLNWESAVCCLVW